MSRSADPSHSRHVMISARGGPKPGSRWMSTLVLLAGLVFLTVVIAGCKATAPASPTPTPTLLPTETPTPVPTPACVEPSLAIGAARYRVESIAPAADGSLVVPPDTTGVVYWVEGTTVHYLFALSPSAANLALRDTVQVGDTAIITWADCTTDAYQVETVEDATYDLTALADQSSGGLTVFAPSEADDRGLVISAERPTATAAETPETADEGEGIRIDIAFGETTISADGSTIAFSVTITNTGGAAFSLMDQDLALTPDGGEPLAPVLVEPALPQEIEPGAGKAFEITFRHPRTKVALLRILDVTLEQYY